MNYYGIEKLTRLPHCRNLFGFDGLSVRAVPYAMKMDAFFSEGRDIPHMRKLGGITPYGYYLLLRTTTFRFSGAPLPVGRKLGSHTPGDYLHLRRTTTFRLSTRQPHPSLTRIQMGEYFRPGKSPSWKMKSRTPLYFV